MHWASIGGHIEVANALLSANADIAARTQMGVTSLHLAAAHGHLELVQFLLDTSAVLVSLKDNNGWNALHWAAHEGHFKIVQSLLNTLAKLDDSRAPWPKPPRECPDLATILEYLTFKRPDDKLLRRILAVEFLRQKRYQEAQISYDIFVKLALQGTANGLPQEIDFQVICDQCHQPIRGYYYKCIQCHWNIDICHTCLETFGHQHPNNLIKIPSKVFEMML